MTAPIESLSRAATPVVLWLMENTGFPASRLETKAELLLLVTAAAAEEDARMSQTSARPGASVGSAANGPSLRAHLRQYTIQRRQVHMRCDNSAKV